MKVKDIWDDFIEHGKSMGKHHNTIYQYQRMKEPILKNVGDFKLSKINKNNCDLIRRDCALMGKTRERQGLITLRKLFQYACDEGYKINFYWKDITMPRYIHRPIEYLCKEEIQEIREVLENEMNDPRYHKQKFHNALKTRVIFELILHSGLRIGEICSLNWSDISMENEEMRVKNIKNKKVQVVYFTGATYWLKVYRDHVGKLKNDAVFLSTGLFGHGILNKRMTALAAKKMAGQLAKKLHWAKRFHWHIARKTYCTELLRGKADIKTVQYLARHESPQTTLNYYVAVDRENAKDIHGGIMCCV